MLRKKKQIVLIGSQKEWPWGIGLAYMCFGSSGLPHTVGWLVKLMWREPHSDPWAGPWQAPPQKCNHTPRLGRPQELWLVYLVASHFQQTCCSSLRKSNCSSTSICSNTRHCSEVNRDAIKFETLSRETPPPRAFRLCNCSVTHTHLRTTTTARPRAQVTCAPTAWLRLRSMNQLLLVATPDEQHGSQL